MEQEEIRKIVIIGPESTGKSSLCAQLAQHYHTEWCGEYARQYLTEHGKNYAFENLETIAKGQLALEDEYVNKLAAQSKTQINIEAKNKSPLLFIDTDMYVMKVWCEYVFGKCHPYILNQIAQRKYDLYLLCNIDLPWSYDPLREYPDEKPRQELYRIYKDILINQAVPWVEISGNYEQRLKMAINGVQNIL